MSVRGVCLVQGLWASKGAKKPVAPGRAESHQQIKTSERAPPGERRISAGRFGIHVQLGGSFIHFYFHPYLGKVPILTNIFQMG